VTKADRALLSWICLLSHYLGKLYFQAVWARVLPEAALLPILVKERTDAQFLLLRLQQEIRCAATPGGGCNFEHRSGTPRIAGDCQRVAG
jgi:hypothetical protein